MKWNKKGEVGITYLVVLVGSLLVSGTAASVVISTTDQSANIANDLTDEVLLGIVQGLIIVDSYCEIREGEVQNINILVKLSPGSPEINLDHVLIIMTTDTDVQYLTHNESGEQHYQADRVISASACTWNDTAHIIGDGDMVRLTISGECSRDFIIDLIPSEGFKTTLDVNITTDEEGFVTIF